MRSFKNCRSERSYRLDVGIELVEGRLIFLSTQRGRLFLICVYVLIDEKMKEKKHNQFLDAKNVTSNFIHVSRNRSIQDAIALII